MGTERSILFPVTRRGFFLGGAAALAAARGVADTPTCALTPEQEQGPYYIDYEQLRPNVTEGKPGVPLQLRIALVDSKSCAPLEKAVVDIWHCDASGIYSGFAGGDGPGGRGPGRGGPGRGGPGGFGPGGFGPGDVSPDGPGRGRGPGGDPGGQDFFPDGPPPGRGPDNGPGGFRGPGGPGGGPPPSRIVNTARFLRGVQISDKKGLVDFATLYPGWYQGRAIHIHLKVHLGGKVTVTQEAKKYDGGHVSHTGQLFFPEDITQDVAKLQPYAQRLNVHRTTQEEDGVFRGQHGAAVMLNMKRLKNGSNEAGFLATITLAIDPEATPGPVGGGRGPGGRGSGGGRGPGGGRA